ncbi:diguanylate cyclase [Aliiglaciecola sp. CAU 1673]|uniref:tetratricopeptide repeat-containing diguanylate cyclase n=1 Tax=Aliiglaciecola sp. CAU 1673 TaxID=3032595 RepID=UPI0023DCCC2B|nr:tetratricopeptide repeat-containing diguanylate cyclase [Aliiglaciecola sp. CAU 1673]MDF2179407.1 diguanylate cyclase [Aliiglaciecola sp. CAU 1673]
MNASFLIIFLVMNFIVGISFAGDEFNSLEYADSIKSKDTFTFKKILQELDGKKESLSQKELDYLHFLESYMTAYSGNLEDGISGYKAVYKNSKHEDLKVRSAASIVNLYGLMRDFENGYSWVLELQKKIQNSSGKIKHIGLVALAIFLNQVGEYESGLSYAEGVIDDAPDPRNLCFALNLSIEAKFELKKDVSEEALSKLIEVCDKEKEFVASSMAFIWEANNLIGKSEFERAKSKLQASLELVNNTHYPPAISEHYSLTALIHMHEGEYSKAVESANKSLDVAKNLGNTRPTVSAFRTLYQVAELQGKPDEALFYYKKFAEADRAYIDEVKAKQLAIQQAKHDAIERANQIALLDKENSLLKTEARLTKQEQQNDRLFMAFLMLVILLVVLWAYKNRRLHLQMRQQAQTDDLTGIANRHHFTQMAESALKYHQKSAQPLSFIIFDLDLFKRINDTYGHQVGDWALKAAVAACQSVCRQQDIIGRMGGEEFGLVLPGCSLNKAMEIAEACRKAIAAIDTRPSGEKFQITASFGVSDSTVCGYVFDSLYGCADKALYHSKEQGRNRVYRYEEDLNLKMDLRPQ